MPFWQSEIIKVIVKYREPVTIENERVPPGLFEAPPMQLNYAVIHEFLFQVNPPAEYEGEVRGPPNPVNLQGKSPEGLQLNDNSKGLLSFEPPGPAFGVESL